jgi:hypothetical protein
MHYSHHELSERRKEGEKEEGKNETSIIMASP